MCRRSIVSLITKKFILNFNNKNQIISVIARGVNDAGRGINLVVIGNGKEVIKTAHFDTYNEDSTNLEIFIEGLNDNVIVIAVTFDEASQK